MYYRLLVIFTIIATLSTCAVPPKDYVKWIPEQIKDGRCKALDWSIENVSQDAQLYAAHRSKFKGYREECKQVAKRQHKEKQRKIQAESNRLQAIKDADWEYIKDEVLTLQNAHLMTIGQSVCIHQSNKRYIAKGNITRINGDVFEVTYQAVLNTGYDNFGYTPARYNSYTRFVPPKPNWFKLDSSTYKFWVCPY